MGESFHGLQEALAGRYTIEREIGRGGMATVYLAQDLRHERTVALKVLAPDLSHELGAERFLREIRLAARLSHPHILPLYDSGEGAGRLYYVMPYVEGESLRQRLDRERQLPLDEALRITHEVAEALDHAHAAGIVHRDIKPENILLSGGHAVVADFGIARAVDVAGGERLTATGLAVGTPGYMSPEQTAGDRAVDARADVYSLACVTYEMLGGTPPFTAATPQALMARHAVDPVPSLRTVRATVTRSMDGVLAQGLAKAPADRPSSATAFAESLALAHRTGGADAPDGEATTAARPMFVLRVGRPALVAGLVIILAAIAASRWRSGSAANGDPQLASLAVLPFDNIAGDSTQEYFVSGMHDALVGALGQISRLRVLWLLASTRQYAGSPKPDSQIAHELGVDGLVRGTVLRDGDSVHFQVRLIRAQPSTELVWAQEYSRPIRGVLAMHAEVARAIAAEAGVAVDSSAGARLARTRDITPETYEAYLRGMFHIYRQTPDDITDGVRYLEGAVQRDPGDAHAWAGLALGYGMIGHGPASPPDVWAKARAAAQRAVTLMPDLAEGHAALADVLMYYDHDWAGAEAEFRRAIELNPSLALNRFHYSWYLLLQGRDDEALAEHLDAENLDPLTPVITANTGELYLWLGRFEEARRKLEDAIAREPEHPYILTAIGDLYEALGQPDSAAAALRLAARVPEWRYQGVRADILEGRTATARRTLAALEREPPDAFSALQRAMMHALLGEMDAAFRWLEYRPMHAWVPWMRIWPGYDALRADPRFPAFLASVNLPAP